MICTLYNIHREVQFERLSTIFIIELILLAGLGLKAFRTSINSSRMFPKGDELEPSEAGLKFYDDLIEEIIKNDMEPMITISHYEMPLYLTTAYKGWYSRQVIEFFVRYCKVLFDRYKGKVNYWIIVNQINLIVHESFNHLGIAEDVLATVKRNQMEYFFGDVLLRGYYPGYAS